MKKQIGIYAVLLCAAVIIISAGCVGNAPQNDNIPAPAVTETSWTVWKDAAMGTVNTYPGYLAYTPTANGVQFKNLKTVIESDLPLSVVYLDNKNYEKFMKYLSTNTGKYEVEKQFDDVTSGSTECHSDKDLNVVVWNRGSKGAMCSIQILYQ